MATSKRDPKCRVRAERAFAFYRIDNKAKRLTDANKHVKGKMRFLIKYRRHMNLRTFINNLLVFIKLKLKSYLNRIKKPLQ